jgi:hypothetical protein
VSRGRKIAKEIDGATIKRARLVADFCLTLHPVTDDEALKERRRKTLRNVEDYLEDIGTPKFESNMQVAVCMWRAGGRHWGELCLALAAHFIERGEPVPEPMRKLVADTLRGLQLPKPEAEKTRDQLIAKRFPGFLSEKRARDSTIALAVHTITVDTGLKPTRNRARRTKGSPSSACSIVHEALRLRKINLSEDAVEKIWLAHAEKLRESYQEIVKGMVVAGLEPPSPKNPFRLKESY